MPDADLSATLAEAKRRHHHGHTSNPRRDYCTADNQDWPCDVSRLLTALEAVTVLHKPKTLYGLAFGGLNYDKPLCAHDPDADHDAHFEGDDGLWYCQDKITGQACISCADLDAADLWAEWPCPTYLAITTALTGKEAGDEKAAT